MDVENPLAITPMIIDDPHLAAINDVMATAGPLVLDSVQYDNPWRPGDLDDEDKEGNQDVGFRTYGEETRKEKIVSDADRDGSELHSRVPFNPLTMLQSHGGAL